MQSSTEHIYEIQRLFKLIDANKDWIGMRKRLDGMQADLKSESLWDDNVKAIEMQIESSKLRDLLDEYDQIRGRFVDSKELMEMLKVDADHELLFDLNKETASLKPIVSSYFMKTLMNQESDKNSCFIELRAGAGGTESCDWVEIISRMYSKWAVERGYSCIFSY